MGGASVRLRGAVLIALCAVLVSAAPAWGAGRFQVRDGRVLAPSGQQFVLRAAGALDGWFVGEGHVVNAKAVRAARREFRSIASRGFNGVRLRVRAEGVTAERLAGLRRVVAEARRARLVTVIANVDSSSEA